MISTITGDFNNSSIIGYVKISVVPKQQQQPTSPNPFADKTTISKKIETEISSVLSSSSSSNFVKTSIHCDFGMSLSDWKCKSLGLSINSLPLIVRISNDKDIKKNKND